MNTNLRVVIADDHPIFRDGLRAMISSSEEMELVGEASTGTEAVALAGELGPDVIVMDIQMPEASGLEATRRITTRDPEARILIVTMFEDDANVFAAMRAGARGYVLKGANYGEMLRAIKAVGSGEAIFSPRLATRLAEFFSGSRAGTTSAFPELTDREREVLSLIARGMKNAEIARELYLSPKTVRNQVSNVLHKLQAADRTEAALRAKEAGLG